MAGFNKVSSYQEAMAGLENDMTVIAGIAYAWNSRGSG